MGRFAKRAGLLVVVAGAVAACAGPTTKTTSETTTTLPSLPGLPLRMLNLHDLPGGWTVNNDASSTSTFSCLRSRTRPAGELARGQVAFRRAAKAVQVVAETAGSFSRVGAVDAYMTLVSAFDECTDVAVTANGHRIPGTLRALSVAAVGDASRAWQIEFSTEFGGVALSVFMDVLVFRVGSYDGELLSEDVQAPDLALFQRLAARAAAKFGDSAA